MTGATPPLPAEVAAALHRLDDLVRGVEQHPDEAVQETLIEVLRAVDVLQRGVLERIAALLDAHALRDEARADPHVALLFGLYEAQDEAPDEDARARAEAAVADLQPYVASHGGRLEVVAAEDGLVNIRLLRRVPSCCGSPATLTGLVEEALRTNLAEFVRMDVSTTPPQAAPEPRQPAPVLIPLSPLAPPGPSGQQAPGWVGRLRGRTRVAAAPAGELRHRRGPGGARAVRRRAAAVGVVVRGCRGR